MLFSGIAGHRKNLAALERLLASGRIAHAFLFAGPAGIGKALIARAFIQALFCTDGTACGSCPPCRRLAAGSHPDLHILVPDGQFIKIDQVRELQKELGYRPYEASRKVCIIDGAEKLNPSSGNALLKTLEEPPGNALMILLTPAAENVLPTIRSRCQQLVFSPVPADEITALLTAQGTDVATAGVAALLADGSVARAIELCSSDGSASRHDIITRACRMSLTDMTGIFAFGEMFDKDRDRALRSLDFLLSFWRDMLKNRTGATDAVNMDLAALLAAEAGRRSNTALIEGLETIMKTRQAILRNANVRLAMDVLGMKLAA
jgi:DNA polymerase-3 subunit delta'